MFLKNYEVLRSNVLDKNNKAYSKKALEEIVKELKGTNIPIVCKPSRDYSLDVDIRDIIGKASDFQYFEGSLLANITLTKEAEDIIKKLENDGIRLYLSPNAEGNIVGSIVTELFGFRAFELTMSPASDWREPLHVE